jgi:hypothetical protein
MKAGPGDESLDREEVAPAEDYASVVIRLGNANGTSEGSFEEIDTLLTNNVDNAAITSGADFVVTYDLRCCNYKRLTAAIATALERRVNIFFEDPRAAKLRGAKFVAVLFEGSIFEEQTIAFLGKVVNRIAPTCPLCLSHSEITANNFFQTTAGKESQAEFVSMVGVEKDIRNKKVASDRVVASLAPSGSNAFKAIGHAVSKTQPTTYVLPNGDTRVIQSLSSDVVMGRRWQLDRGVTAGNGGGSNPTSGELQSSIGALLFKGPYNLLVHLIGVHISVAELIIDADRFMLSAEGFAPPGRRRFSRAPTQSTSTFLQNKGGWRLSDCITPILQIVLGPLQSSRTLSES